jgi:hypothetical protein
MNSDREKIGFLTVVQFPSADETRIVIKIRRGFFLFCVWAALTLSPVVTRVPREECKDTNSLAVDTLPSSKPRSRRAVRKSLKPLRPCCSVMRVRARE